MGRNIYPSVRQRCRRSPVRAQWSAPACTGWNKIFQRLCWSSAQDDWKIYTFNEFEMQLRKYSWLDSVYQNSSDNVYYFVFIWYIYFKIRPDQLFLTHTVDGEGSIRNLSPLRLGSTVLLQKLILCTSCLLCSRVYILAVCCLPHRFKDEVVLELKLWSEKFWYDQDEPCQYIL